MNCIFCKIINEEVPSKTIFEDEVVKVFLTIEPHSPGHALIIPKKHILDAFEIDDDTFKHINSVIKSVGNLLQDRLKCDGIKIIQNNGICQEVKHYHIHLIPKYKNKKILNLDEVYNLLK